MADGRALRRADFVPREGEGLASGQIFTTREPGQRGSFLRREPGEERVLLRGGPGGVGAFRRAVPEEGFAPAEETLAFVKGAEAPVPGAAGPGEPGAAPSAEVGTPNWARAEMQKATKKHETQIAERTKIVEDISSMGADLATLGKILKSKGLDNLKEPKHEKWLVELAQKTPSPTELKGGILQRRFAGEEVGAEEERFISGEVADPTFDRALGIVRNSDDFKFGTTEEKLLILTDVQEQIKQAQGGGSDVGGLKELDEATAQAIFERANGNPDIARQIARQEGFRF